MSVWMRQIADSIVDVIGENQRLGALWDHWECFTRPMSSWTTMIAALDMKVDREKWELRLSPISAQLRVPLCIPDVLTDVTFRSGECAIHILEGSLEGWDIQLDKGWNVIVQ